MHGRNRRRIHCHLRVFGRSCRTWPRSGCSGCGVRVGGSSLVGGRTEQPLKRPGRLQPPDIILDQIRIGAMAVRS
eukprot:976776-Prymnesium_polylepis.1